ncbi:MAG: pilus assembly protein PilM [Desulfurivibrio sp.]|nr:pilus assembly protein PilM [Desulfurivibrio sp.]
MALVDIGASKMNINIVADGASALTQDVVLGGWHLTEQIQRALDLSFAEAEDIKLGRVAPADEEARQQVAALVLDTCRQWSAEIERALDKYRGGNPEQEIGRVILSGGGARLAGLADFLERENGLPTSVYNPFVRVTADPGRRSSRLPANRGSANGPGLWAGHPAGGILISW